MDVLSIHNDAMDLDPLGQFDQKLLVARQVVDGQRITLRERGHRFHVGPVGDGREPGLVVAVLSQELDAEGTPSARL